MRMLFNPSVLGPACGEGHSVITELVVGKGTGRSVDVGRQRVWFATTCTRLRRPIRTCSSMVERAPDKGEAVGSSPIMSIVAVAQRPRASGCDPEDRQFESGQPPYLLERRDNVRYIYGRGR